jgi:hypothetical protein
MPGLRQGLGQGSYNVRGIFEHRNLSPFARKRKNVNAWRLRFFPFPHSYSARSFWSWNLLTALASKFGDCSGNAGTTAWNPLPGLGSKCERANPTPQLHLLVLDTLKAARVDIWLLSNFKTPRPSRDPVLTTLSLSATPYHAFCATIDSPSV